MGQRETVRLVIRLLRQKARTSAIAAERIVTHAIARAGLEQRRYFDDLDIEAALSQVSLRGHALRRAATRISRARARVMQGRHAA